VSLSSWSYSDDNICRPSESELSDGTVAYLEARDLTAIAGRSPESAISILAGRFNETGSIESGRALGEIALTGESDESVDLSRTLMAMSLLHGRVARDVGTDVEDRCLTELYNRNLARVVLGMEELAGSKQAEDAIEVDTLSGRVRLFWRSGDLGPVWSARSHRLVPADEFDSSVFEQRVVGRGIGAPFLTLRRAGVPEEVRVAGGFFPDYVFFYPLTVIAEVDWNPCGLTTVALRVVDPLLTTETDVAGRRVPMSFDITAQAAAFFELVDLQGRGRLGLRDAERVLPETGLFLIEPFRPDKIPVVFVHGLDAVAVTWIEPLIAMYADPRIRENYQFWSFQYPSGLPFLYSSHLLRRALRETVEEFDSVEARPQLDRMVLVGHSMGGLLCRLQATSSGDELWRVLFEQPLDDLELTEDDRDLIRDIYFVEPSSFVSRLVFIATPHRGSDMAAGLLGKLGAALVKLPRSIEEIAERVIGANKGHLTEAGLKRLRAPDSIERLSSRDPILLALDSLRPTVPFHSIMGNHERGDFRTGSDGVVDYASSHLEGAESELIVEADHSAHQHPAAIAELRRILLHHLERGGRAPDD
jgi:pimeloyl-ACP methyl ester carboxylesterase